MIKQSLLLLFFVLIFTPALAEQVTQDAKIKGQILSTLYFDQNVREPQKMVDIKQGVVMINSILANPSTLLRIEQATKHIKGVKRIQFHSTSKS